MAKSEMASFTQF